jgi:hypothetical protein
MKNTKAKARQQRRAAYKESKRTRAIKAKVRRCPPQPEPIVLDLNNLTEHQRELVIGHEVEHFNDALMALAEATGHLQGAARHAHVFTPEWREKISDYLEDVAVMPVLDLSALAAVIRGEPDPYEGYVAPECPEHG